MLTKMLVVNSLLVVAVLIGASSCSPFVQEPNLIRLQLFKAQTGELSTDPRLEQTFVDLGGKRSAPAHPNESVFRHNLLNIRGFNYFTNIKIGQPAQEFRVMLDTGSRDLWLPSVKCPDNYCKTRHTYDSSKSSSYIEDGRELTLQYGNGVAVKGQLSVDQLELAKGLTIERQTFLEALHLQGRALQVLPLDGVLGILVHPNHTEHKYSSPIMSILDHHGLGRRMFSLSLRHKLNSDEAGEFIIGGIDPAVYRGKITWARTTLLERWEFMIDSIEVHTRSSDATGRNYVGSTCQSGCMAVPDTGSHMIIGHDDQVFEINKLLGAKPDVNGLFKFDDCNLLNKPLLVFSIAGRDLVLPPSAYVVRFERGCFSPIKTERFASLDHWVMGDMFLGNLYTIFDYDNKQIGFAESVFKRNEGRTSFD